MNPFNDEYFMKQALVEARAAADEGEVPRRGRCCYVTIRLLPEPITTRGGIAVFM